MKLFNNSILDKELESFLCCLLIEDYLLIVNIHSHILLNKQIFENTLLETITSSD